MKGFFSMFISSAKELKTVRCITVTSIFIAISMVIETFTIEIPYAKINFAFIAIAVIGMLYGPVVGAMASGICDIVGFFAHPQGSFLPLYTCIAVLQGLIYGICLYHKMDKHSIMYIRNSDGHSTDITLYLRAIIARLLDVVLINILLNTRVNLYYKFIPDKSYGAAIITRTAKNVIELFADIPLLFILLPIALVAYKRVFQTKLAKNV